MRLPGTGMALAALLAAGQTGELRAPRPLAPAAGARVSTPVTFSWSRVPEAAGYAIQVAQQEDFSPPLLVDRTVSERRFETSLAAAGTLWWRVRAVDPEGGTSPWSEARRFELAPPPLATSVFAITLNPSQVTGGESTQALVTLTDPAPAGGASVAISTSDRSKTKAPARVVVAAGATVAAFGIATSQVSEGVTVRISAGARANTESAALTIAPPRPPSPLTSLGLVPAVVAAGGHAQGTVTLAGMAPAPSGVRVRLASGDAAVASVPATVTIPAGTTAANFAIDTARLTVTRSVSITAALEGISRSANLTVRAAASGAALGAPAPLGPEERGTVAHDQPMVFSWSPVIGAASYTIEIDDSSDFEAPLLIDRTIPETTVTITPLPPGVLWWRVRANDGNGAPGQWSPPRALLAQ